MNSFFPHYLLRLSLGRWEIHQGRVCDPEVLELINLFTDGSNLHCMIVAQTFKLYHSAPSQNHMASFFVTKICLQFCWLNHDFAEAGISNSDSTD